MGRANRLLPEKLGEKLRAVRLGLEIKTFEEMIARLDCPQANLYASSIYLYEGGSREPPLIVLLRYAQLAGVTVDVLIDDKKELPIKLPLK